jgi:hypothetical protein
MLEGMLKAAHASLDAGRYQEAIAAYTAILKRDQRNVDAITHMGVILALAGQGRGPRGVGPGARHRSDYAHALGQGWRPGGAPGSGGRHARAFVRVAGGPDRDRAQQRPGRWAGLRRAKAGAPVARGAGGPRARCGGLLAALVVAAVGAVWG